MTGRSRLRAVWVPLLAVLVAACVVAAVWAWRAT